MSKEAVRNKELYVKNTANILAEKGLFLITSCNWTKVLIFLQARKQQRGFQWIRIRLKMEPNPDPAPALFVRGFRGANKKKVILLSFFCLLLSVHMQQSS